MDTPIKGQNLKEDESLNSEEIGAIQWEKEGRKMCF